MFSAACHLLSSNHSRLTDRQTDRQTVMPCSICRQYVSSSCYQWWYVVMLCRWFAWWRCSVLFWSSIHHQSMLSGVTMVQLSVTVRWSVNQAPVSRRPPLTVVCILHQGFSNFFSPWTPLQIIWYSRNADATWFANPKYSIIVCIAIGIESGAVLVQKF